MANQPKIVKANDTVTGSLKILIYGDSGVGKTVFGSTAPEPLYLSAEAGLLSIASKDIDTVTISTWTDLNEAFEWLKSGKHPYKTVVVDSLTELQKKNQDHLLAASGKKDMTQQLWGQNIEAMRKACRAFRDLPLNIVLIALSNEIVAEDGGTPLKRPSLQGKSLPNEVMGFVDLVGYMVAQEKKDEATGETVIQRGIRFQPSENVSAKDRSGKLNIWEPPDFTTIYGKVFGKTATKEAK